MGVVVMNWIAHDGGPRPVKHNTLVTVLLRDKDGGTCRPCAGQYGGPDDPMMAMNYGWEIAPHLSGAIIGYRVHGT